MQVYFREYGWMKVSFLTWLRAKIFCYYEHYWKYLGDPCYCGSDNCYKCEGCGYETHD